MIEIKSITGDVAISRHASIGGTATVRGSATVGHNLKVEGWLDAKNIRTPCKGLFQSEALLKDAYPKGHPGWWAVVGESLPAELYVVGPDGEWADSGTTWNGSGLALDQYDRWIDTATADIAALQSGMAALTFAEEQDIRDLFI